MKITDLELSGLKLIELDVYKDDLGFFVERFNAVKFAELGINATFVQDNHSRSAPGVLRGLHFQYAPRQAKLVGAITGRIWDVVVDLRPDSPTFKKWKAIELSGDNGRLLWVPFGFAHGFCVIGNEPADVMYKVDALYGRGGEGGIHWSDSELGIEWPVREPRVSAKDEKLPKLSELSALLESCFRKAR
jgi:dTDP-4-dehydrorhamnose 3,5-epimerase